MSCVRGSPRLCRERGRVRGFLGQLKHGSRDPSPQSSPLAQGERGWRNFS